MKLSVFQGRWGVRIGLFLGLLAVLFLLQRRLYRPVAPVVPVSPPSRSSAQMHQDWRAGVKGALQRYDQNMKAVEARDALLALTVTRDDQPVHLALVLAFNALAEGRTEGQLQLDEARRMVEAL